MGDRIDRLIERYGSEYAAVLRWKAEDAADRIDARKRDRADENWRTNVPPALLELSNDPYDEDGAW